MWKNASVEERTEQDRTKDWSETSKEEKYRVEKRVVRKWNCLLTEVDREVMEEVEEQ